MVFRITSIFPCRRWNQFQIRVELVAGAYCSIPLSNFDPIDSRDHCAGSCGNRIHRQIIADFDIESRRFRSLGKNIGREAYCSLIFASFKTSSYSSTPGENQRRRIVSASERFFSEETNARFLPVYRLHTFDQSFTEIF